MQFILKIGEKSVRIMKRIDQNRKNKSRKTAVNTVMVVVIALLLIAGVVLILIEPIKRYNRKKISSEALTVISEKIEATDEVEITYTVPATGNEVAGEEEGYDIIGGDEEETAEEADVIFEEEPENNSGSSEMVSLRSIGILSIGKIKISYSVWDEATKVSLRYGLGHYPDSVLPGEVGNATILGHNYKDGTMFHNLGKLKKGDKVVFKSKDGKEMTFVVEESKIINANDLSKYVAGNITDERQLTLITCTYEYGRKGWRRVVICKLQ